MQLTVSDGKIAEKNRQRRLKFKAKNMFKIHLQKSQTKSEIRNGRWVNGHMN